MTEEQEQKPPKTVEELGIHFVYMSKNITELKDMIKAHTLIMATKEELRGHNERIEKIERKLENKMVSKTEFKIGISTITVALSVIIAIITIWDNIRG